MRWLALLLAVLACGCLGEGPRTQTDPSTLDAVGPMVDPLPDDLHINATMPASGGPLLNDGDDDCATPTVHCDRYPFHLDRGAVATIHLLIGIPGNDLDFYLYENGNKIASSTGPSYTFHEFGRQLLQADDYEVVVQGSANGPVGYQLDVWFDEP